VRTFAGHMSQAAKTVCASWVDGMEIDLDAECRGLTLRALGRSVLGLNLDEHTDALAAPLRVALESSPIVHAPRLLVPRRCGGRRDWRTALAAELGRCAQLGAAQPAHQFSCCHGMASAKAICPSKPSVLAISR
jgi:hypothetical protein